MEKNKPRHLSIKVNEERELNIDLVKLTIIHHFPNKAHLFSVSAGKSNNTIDIDCPNHESARKLHDLLFGGIPIPRELLEQTAEFVNLQNKDFTN
jgi:hypothetical protein